MILKGVRLWPKAGLCVSVMFHKCVVYVGDLGQVMGSVMLVNKEKSVSEP